MTNAKKDTDNSYQKTKGNTKPITQLLKQTNTQSLIFSLIFAKVFLVFQEFFSANVTSNA